VVLVTLAMQGLLFTHAAAAAAPAVPAAGRLDPVETAIATHVDSRREDAIALLQRVVDINSGTHNFAGVRKTGDAFRERFDALGFKTEWVDGATWKRAGHLVARHEAPGPKVLLIGHLDTVFEADSPFQKFERIDEDTAKGPGIIDMKGGNVVIVSALEALAAAKQLDRMNLVVVLTGDEEDSGDPLEVARKALVDAADGAAIALGFENGSGDPKVAITQRRGIAGWELRVTGKPGHASQIFTPELGFGAIYETARILDAMRAQLAAEPNLTFNPGVILGGTAVEFDAVNARGNAAGKSNVVAKDVVVTGDLRGVSAEQMANAQATMQAIVAKSLPGTKATLTDPRKAGAADISYIGDRVGAALDGIGLMGHDDHSEGETADLRTLTSQAKRAAVLLYRWRNAQP
jgi:glutamate carboxypeptidase